jgi:hypothetical protein
MPPGSDKWIRSIKENPAGKVVADNEGNRWEWQSDDETHHQLKKLNNDELSIERTDLRPALRASATRGAATAKRTVKSSGRLVKPGARDAGGGFNPYDHSVKPKRR